MPAPLAVFGINNSTLDTVVKLLVLFVVLIWLALVYYTWADARRRISDPILIGTATLAALVLPFAGTIIYMVVRPPEYLDDVRERELEMQAAEARLLQSGVLLCPHCEYQVQKDFLRCPSCLKKLRDQCTGCARPLDPEWRICPFCETEIPGRTPRRRRARAAGPGGPGEDEPQAEPDPREGRRGEPRARR
ncbi:double zinc ribbon domain-containing protein [Patulibacter americanus]|uniref:double zinc ribbon domain-containing protein n=1 Tax=Patulibacter americanus TaxID=588672 RepID=UPI0003B46439|nr:zinc ribbon domain-containing protein [Patulibacter americanus]